MANSVQMPPLGESVTEGTVTRWLKQVGDRVAADEPLVEIATDKVDTELPSPVSGVLLEITVAEDETAAVGEQIAVIGEESEAQQGGSDGAGPDTAVPAQAPAQQEARPASQQDDPDAHEDDEPHTPQAPSSVDSGTSAASSPDAAGPADAGTAVTMPALGESVTEGTVTRWLKQVGQQVEVDEPLLEVATDKVDTEIPSPVAGVVTQLLVAEDETALVGAVLAFIGSGVPSGSPSPAPAPAVEPERHGAPQDQPQASRQDTDAAPAGTATTPPEAEPAAAQAAAPVAATASPGQAATVSANTAPVTTAPAARAQDTTAASGTDPAPATRHPAPDSSSAFAAGGGYVTPLVRKMASDAGVELSAVRGSGLGGRIRKQDVTAAAEEAKRAADARRADEAGRVDAARNAASAPAPTEPVISPKRGTTEKMSRLRRVIAQRMVESLQSTAQLTTVVEVDVTRVARLRDRAKHGFQAREGVKLSFLPFFALATVEALKSHPVVNSSLEGDQVVYHGAEHLGIAVDTDKGLLVPVVKDAGDLNIAGLARKIADLAERTRTNAISPDELGGGTFTLTNTGSRGALFDTPILNSPQVGILGTGAVVKRPVVVTDADGNESIAVRSMVYLALSYDHRIVDGADAARFLTTVKSRLEQGAFESALGL